MTALSADLRRTIIQGDKQFEKSSVKWTKLKAKKESEDNTDLQTDEEIQEIV